MSTKYVQPYEEGSKLPSSSRGLKLIGLRFYSGDVGGEGERLVRCIQKSLYGRAKWFYFNKGFEIIENTNSEITEITVDESTFDSSFILYSEPESNVKISISAIVGQNGTGKSTIVDTVIRLLNNLSAAIIGEDYVYSTAHHLHYIDGVYASLAFYQDSCIKILTCKGRKLTITRFDAIVSKSAHQAEASSEPIIEHYTPQESITILNGQTTSSEPLPSQKSRASVLQDLFYTLVSNYSLYAYNYRDYLYERSSDAKISQLNDKQMPDNDEDFYWLKGLFHKNDGYQTPVVIHPMRDDGYINAARVNSIGKQNLISLCFEKVSEKDKDDNFPFRIINQTHHIVAFTIYRGKRTYRNFDEWLSLISIGKNSELWEKLVKLEQPIKQFWSNIINVPHDNPDCQGTWNYLTYKTIKVLRTYIQYKTIWKKIEEGIIIDTINSDLLELLQDSSHRTLKIRRAVCFLRFYEENNYYMNCTQSVDLDVIYKWMQTKIGENIYPNKNYHQITTDDLLPTPVVDIRLELVDNEHWADYKKGALGVYNIPFEGLSSGERQIAYTLGNILYHLKNIESGNYDINIEENHQSSFKYHYVNIMLDEVELYFHPDLQRRFIKLLVDSITGLNLEFVQGINITVITHSPFVLSDIPDSNILYLSRNEGEKISGQTFAANIHDLFNNTFILQNTIGAFAEKKISEIISYYREYRIDSSSGPDFLSDMNDKHFKRMQYISRIIGDEYLSNAVKDMLEEIEELKNR